MEKLQELCKKYYILLSKLKFNNCLHFVLLALLFFLYVFINYIFFFLKYLTVVDDNVPFYS